MELSTKKEDKLFRLIKSMHKGEKRFFAVYCSHYGNVNEKVYLQLFRAIDSQKKHNEEALKKKIDNKASVKHLHSIKDYLHNLILDSLYLYRSRNNKSFRTKLFRAETYFEKGLYDLTEQALNKLRKEAEQEEDFITLFEILRLEKRLMLIMANINEDKQNLILEKEKMCFDSYKEVCDYMNLGIDVAYIHFKHLAGINLAEIKSKQIDKRSIFNNTEAPHTTYSKYLLHNARATYYRTISNFKQASEECAMALEEIESNEVFKESHLETTFAALFNYVTSLLILQDYKKAFKTIVRLKSFSNRNISRIRENLLIKYLIMEQRISRMVGEKKEAIQQIENMERFITSHHIAELDKIIFYFNAVDTYLLYGNYSRAMYWLNSALNHKGIEKINITLYHYLRIIQIIILFEMKDYELMEYRLRSLYRHLAKQTTLGKFEKVFLGFFRDILKSSEIDGNSVPQLLMSLKASLVKVFEDRNERITLQYFDILNWVDSKLKTV